MSGERQRAMRHTRQRCEVCGGPVFFDSSQRIHVCSSCGLVQSGRGEADISFRDVIRELQFATTVEELATRLSAGDWEVERVVLLMQKEGLVELRGNRVTLTAKGRRTFLRDALE
ncbi:MAG: hypothetical protein KIH01_09230 [Candidatus Freyarchaeota archaeon]|nr:hypothetical protein [Candidatus Jordarchaeia archaeon]